MQAVYSIPKLLDCGQVRVYGTRAAAVQEVCVSHSHAEQGCRSLLNTMSARAQVREYGNKAAAVREARASAAAAAAGTEELEAEVQALFDEMQTQRQILDK